MDVRDQQVLLMIRTDARVENHLFVPDGIEHHFPFIVDPASATTDEARARTGKPPETSYKDYDALIEAVKEAPFGAVYALHALLITESARAYNTPAYHAVNRCELRLIEEVINPRDLYKDVK
jgi:hypothetical protein